MKISLEVTEVQSRSVGYSTFQPAKVETVTLAEVADAELTRPALVGFLRALADSLDEQPLAGWEANQ